MSENDQILKEDLVPFFKYIREQPDNNTCFDCLSRGPAWASATFGVLICYDCSAHHRSMGVHISFVRSTSMDNWNIGHLRNVKVGGNANARAFFTQKRAATLLEPGTDFKQKYESKVAQQYLKELARKCAADQYAHPGREVIVVSEQEENTASGTKSKDDAFDQLASEPVQPRAKPVTLATAEKPRQPGATLGKARSRPRRRRKDIDVDFDALEEEAKEESENMRSRLQQSQQVKSASTPMLLGKQDPVAEADPSSSTPSLEPHVPEQEIRRFKFGQTANEPTKPVVKKQVDTYNPNTSEIHKKFANAKSISSDDFNKSSDTDAADKARLQGFANATSISSSSYFGRDEDDVPAPAEGDYLQQAMQLANKAGMAVENMDMDDVKIMLESGANKLGEFLRSHLR